MTEALAEAEGRTITWGAQVDISDDVGVGALGDKLADLVERGVGLAVVAPTQAGAPDAAARVMRSKKLAGLP